VLRQEDISMQQRPSRMPENRSMPTATVTPALTYRDMGRAIEWLTYTFGFREVWRIENHGALLSFGSGFIFVREPRVVGEPGVASGPEAERAVETAARAACRGSVMLRLEGDPPERNLARFHEQVVQRGARILMQPREEVYGERQFAVEDLDGHHWTFSETIKDVAPEEWGARVAG
jgi:uncharacterized glyoxalase superfamily protein PhnB